jgi:hypothetical protein
MEKRILFKHSATVDGQRFTVAGLYETEVFTDIIVGIALCSEHDNFSKKKGRNISSGRAKAGSGTRGRILKSLYETMNTENYWVGKEIKVFNDKMSEYSNMTASELKDRFMLKKH